MRAVLISGGHIEDEFAISWLRQENYDYIIAADSGMEFLYRCGIMPDVIVGDFDSVGEEIYEYFQETMSQPSVARSTGQERHLWSERMTDESVIQLQQSEWDERIIRLNPVKDDTDTEFAIREAIRRGATEITILGATGTRLDHVLGNIHLLGIGLQENLQIELVDAHNRIRMIQGRRSIRRDEQFGKYVSLLPFGGDATGVTLRGFKYPLENATLESFSSLGISNEIVGDFGDIRIENGTALVIESRD